MGRRGCGSPKQPLNSTDEDRDIETVDVLDEVDAGFDDLLKDRVGVS